MENQHTNHWVASFFWGACEYAGLSIPNVVTTLWLTYSDYSKPLGYLYLVTIFGFVIQTLAFIHTKQLYEKISDGGLLALSLIVFVVIAIMNDDMDIHTFSIVYLGLFALITLVVATAIVHARKSKK